jgi:hypothetical protein
MAAYYVHTQEASHHHHSRKEVLEVQEEHASQYSGVLELGGASFQVSLYRTMSCSVPCKKVNSISLSRVGQNHIYTVYIR